MRGLKNRSEALPSTPRDSGSSFRVTLLGDGMSPPLATFVEAVVGEYGLDGRPEAFLLAGELLSYLSSAELLFLLAIGAPMETEEHQTIHQAVSRMARDRVGRAACCQKHLSLLHPRDAAALALLCERAEQRTRPNRT